MSLIIKDRIKEVTTTTGTGAISLGGATATFESFSSYMTNGDTTYYAIVHTASGVDEWEVGVGTWNTGNTLTRTTVIAGTNDGSPVDFSAGPKDIFMTYPASVAAYTDGSGDLSADIGLGNHSTSELVEGSNLYYTDARVDAHLSGGTGVTYSSGAISIGQDVATTADVTFNTVTLAGDPTTALQAATKEYVDTIAAAGIHYHEPVRVEAPVNLTATYDNGTAGVGATLTNSGTQAAITIDGVALSAADRVLVYNQTNPAHNGIYTVTTVGSGSTNWVLTRATDADTYGVSDKDAMGEGDAYFIKEGATGAGELYVMNTSGAITFGTTPISFTVIAETAVYSAGTGLTLTGTTFAAEQDIATTASPTFNTVTADLVGDTSGTHTGAVVGNVTGDVTGNADTATALETSRTIQLTGDVIGSATFNGTANATITATVQDDSHSHVISNVDGLQSALDAKADDTTTITAGSGLTGGGSIGVNRTISHADTSTQASLTALTGAAVVSDVDVDTYGHVTGLSTRNMTLADLGYTGETNATADQTITAGSGLTGGGTGNVTLNHADTSSQGSVNNAGATVIQDVTLDTYGHVTGLASTALTPATIGAATSAQGALADSATQPGDNISTLTNDAGYTTNVGDITGVTAGSGITGGGTSGTVTINHADTSSQASVNNSGATVIQDVTVDTYGHITGLGSKTLTAADVGAITGNQTITLSGDVSGSGTTSISVTVADDSHNHIIANVDGLQTALDGKLGTSGKAADANLLDGLDSTAFLRSNANDTASGQLDLTYGDQALWSSHSGTGASWRGRMGHRNSAGNTSVFLASYNSNAGVFAHNYALSAWDDLYVNTVDGSSGGTVRLPSATYINNSLAFHDGYHPNADKWTTARTLSLTGDASGSVSWDGSGNASLSVAVNDDSHNHTIANVDGLQTALNGKLASASYNYTQAPDGPSGDFNSQTSRSYVSALNSTANSPFGNAWYNVVNVRHRGGSGDGNSWGAQIVTGMTSHQNRMAFRTHSSGSWSGWNEIWTSGNDGSGSGLDADLLDGLQLTSQNRNNQANRVVRTQSNGYAEFGWINTTSGDTGSNLSRVYVDTGDGYIRKCTLSHLASQGGFGGFSYDAVSGATQALNVGSNDFFDAGTLTADTTLSFSNVPTEARWTYTAEVVAVAGYEINTASYKGEYRFGSASSNPQGFTFKPDGTRLWVVDVNNDSIIEFSLSTAWDVSTISFVRTHYIGYLFPYPVNISFKPDGTRMYLHGASNDTIKEFPLSTPWDTLSLGAQSGSFVYPSSLQYAAYSMYFKPDGTGVYFIGSLNGSVDQFSLSTPWSISTTSHVRSFNVNTNNLSYPNLTGLTFKPDGTRMYTLGQAEDTVIEWSLSTAWNISTASFVTSLNIASADGTPYGLFFKPDGAKMYFVGGSIDRIIEYSTVIMPTITFPTSVQNPPSEPYQAGDQVSYEFFTADGGTTVTLIGEEFT